MPGQIAHILFQAAVWRTESFGQFVEFVVVEFDQIGLFHQSAYPFCVVVRFAQIDIENAEAGGGQQFGQGCAGYRVPSGQAAEYEGIGFGYAEQGFFCNGNFVPCAGINDVLRRAAVWLKYDFDQAGGVFIIGLS